MARSVLCLVCPHFTSPDNGRKIEGVPCLWEGAQPRPLVREEFPVDWFSPFGSLDYWWASSSPCISAETKRVNSVPFSHGMGSGGPAHRPLRFAPNLVASLAGFAGGRRAPPTRRPHSDPGRLQVATGCLPAHRGLLLDTPQRPAQPSQGSHLLSFFFAQDVAYADECASRRNQRPGPHSRWPVWVTAEGAGSPTFDAGKEDVPQDSGNRVRGSDQSSKQNVRSSVCCMSRDSASSCLTFAAFYQIQSLHRA